MRKILFPLLVLAATAYAPNLRGTVNAEQAFQAGTGFAVHPTKEYPGTNGIQIMLFNGVEYDEAKGYSAGTGTYTIPAEGLYLVESSLLLKGGAPNSTYVLQIWKNANGIRRAAYTFTHTDYRTVQISALLQLAANDKIAITLVNNTSTTCTIYPGSHFSVNKVSVR